jgi:hypothetical protein
MMEFARGVPIVFTALMAKGYIGVFPRRSDRTPSPQFSEQFSGRVNRSGR